MKNNKKKKALFKNGWLYSNNQLFLENLYKKFLSNSKKIDISWNHIFNSMFIKKNNENSYLIKKHDFSKNTIHENHIKKNFQNVLKESSYFSLKENFLNLINAYRYSGHKIAKLDPLMLKKQQYIPELSRSFHNIKKKELNFLINFNFLFFKKNVSSFQDIYVFFKKKYCSYIGFEYMHMSQINEKKWLQNYIETNNIKNISSYHTRERILKNLIKSTVLEKFIHTKFPGNKRFSLEGCDILISVLKKIINFCIKKKTNKIFLGMAHRGRLNVMYNVLKYNVLNMFKYTKKEYSIHNGTGDVKYHIGFKKSIQINKKKIKIYLLNNPSHLEIITPVVLGCCKFFVENKNNVDNPLPVIIHGDAAFIGQGVIQETLNMSQVPGYNVFGSIHIIINNQIAFTTSKEKYLRTSAYCTDIAKMINSPIFHVNADHPEEVLYIIKLALKFRYLFKKDVFIDLICYRRLGHNEVDDPYITQPITYTAIKNHPRICVLYAKKIFNKKKKHNISYKKLYKFYKDRLSSSLNQSNITSHKKKILNNLIISPIPILTKSLNFNILKKIASKLFIIPKNFVLHIQVKKIFYNRMQMAENKIPLDWGSVENLAYATLMYYGITCRLTGEDVRRGTFSHRHAIIVCQKSNKIYVPLKNLKNFNGLFHIWDSVLSEESVLAFEHGYSMMSRHVLNVWEAQFGDFSNGAQIVIDQFIVSSLQKWGYSSPLVMFLPHGYEGQGPEHSSARLERYLQLCAQKNIKICIPTTVSQFYHILLKQGCSISRKPLIIFTPKSLLRNPLTFISIKQLSLEKFHSILTTKSNNLCDSINRVIFCSGKIYYELFNFYNQHNKKNTLIIRIEQLYPFPSSKINNVINKYTQLKYFIWCQEEPKNQGSWQYIYFYFKKYILSNNNKILLRYVGRPKLASTAEGYLTDHQEQQRKIIKLAFSILE